MNKEEPFLLDIKSFLQRRSLRSKIILGFSLPVFLMMLLALAAYFSTGAMVETARWVTHTQEVMTRGQLLETLILEMETSEKNFLITGKEEFLAPYHNAKQLWNQEISNGKQQVSDNPPQVQKLHEIDLLAQSWIAEIAIPEINLRRQLTPSSETEEQVSLGKITELIEANQSTNVIRTIRQQIHQFIDVEKALIVERNVAAEAAVNKSFLQTIIGSFVSLILASIVASYLVRSIMSSLKNLNKATQKVANGKFNTRVKVQSDDEIGELANAFNQMTSQLAEFVEALNNSRHDLQQQTDLLQEKNSEIEQTNQNLITTQKQLTTYAEKLEQSSKYKSEFLATMSHEIRTPMNGVLGMLSLLGKTSLTDEQQKRLDMAYSSANSLLTIINDILDFSKVDAGKVELEILEFELPKLLSNFAETIAIRAQQKGLELILDTNNLSSTQVRGDNNRILQILTNLVGNAIKFTSSGEIIIRAYDQIINQDSIKFICEIEDTGIGIPEEQQQHIFEKFKQADASTTRKFGGTGLGLSIVKRLCELMEGNVSVKSSTRGGSCFTFEIKLQSHNRPSLNEGKTQKNVTDTVIILDPNHSNRGMLTHKLRDQWGYKTLAYASATEAIESLENEDINSGIIFINHLLPDMEASTLCLKLNQELKNNGERNINKVLMIPIAQLENANALLELGFDFHISKPVTTQDLSLCLSKFNQITEDHEISIVDTENKKPNKVIVSDNTIWPKELRLMLVEDTFINQEVIKGILHNYPFSIEIAENGEEAIKLLNENTDIPYSLILMDCQMPIMDGYTATQYIRQGAAGEINKGITIIALTANAMAGDRQKCLDAGMNDYLSKPIDAKQLDVTLRQWLCENNQNKDITSS